MENINKDIEILEKVIELAKTTGLDRTLANAIENLIKAYKELEEENKVILNSKVGVDLSFDDYISVSLVEETIEEYKQKIEKYNEYKKQEKETDVEFYENITNTAIIQILQELLEKRK